MTQLTTLDMLRAAREKGYMHTLTFNSAFVGYDTFPVRMKRPTMKFGIDAILSTLINYWTSTNHTPHGWTYYLVLDDLVFLFSVKEDAAFARLLL